MAAQSSRPERRIGSSGSGELYSEGQGVPQDFALAVAWYRKAAEQGNPGAQNNLAVSYYNADGVTRDYVQAVFWWRKAAEQGFIYAEDPLALCYFRGEGVTQDYSQAAEWWEKAAESKPSIPIAEIHLGDLYALGKGVQQDYSQAALWWHKAAEQGDRRAQYILGIAYLNGRVVEQDYAQSYFWLNLAASGGQEEIVLEPILEGGLYYEDMTHDDVARARDDAASRLARPVLMQTQEQVRKWLEEHPAKANTQ